MRYLDLVGHFFIFSQFLKIQRQYLLSETFLLSPFISSSVLLRATMHCILELHDSL